MNRPSLTLAVTAMVAGSLVGIAQIGAAAPKPAPLELDAGPGSAPDPLAPAEADKPAPAAPGAPAAGTASDRSPVEADATVLAVRRLLAAETRAAAAERNDEAGLAAYYAAATKPIWAGREGLTDRGRQAVREIARADDWGLKASAFDLPADPGPQAGEDERAATEIKLSRAVLKYARHARGGRLEPQSISRLFDQKPVIFDPETVLEAIAAAEAADDYLRRLHPQHPQFELLRKAYVKAREAGQKQNAARLLANLERWRWMPQDLGAFHVWDSVPEQMTRVIDNGRTVLAEKIVVGKPTTPTPVFSAAMQFIIFHPEWGVPDGIKTNELAPKLRSTSGNLWLFGGPSASAVLRAHNLRVTYNGRPIDPDSVNWANVNIRNYSFIQPAGPANVLGKVKFRFPNKHDVYMHDTPERHLFNGAVRAFSHGCMRVQNPMRLAEVLLAHDKGWSRDEVEDYERRGGEVTLSTPIPVHVTYFTAVAEESGDVRYFPDLYGLDGRVASALEGERVDVAASAEPRTTPVASTSSRRVTRKPAPKPAWDPLASLFGAN
jgi:murein L,D-transpeptidase YcbB/YkuD